MTERESVEKSLELWQWLADTGAANKWQWPRSEELTDVMNQCFLCEYVAGMRQDNSSVRLNCNICPLISAWGGVDNSNRRYYCEYNPESPYKLWVHSDVPAERKKYAAIIVEGLKNWLKEHKDGR